MTARLSREDGHTLPELLTALVMATVILLATFALLDHVMRRTAETQARVEATQKGRMAMDTITRALRSQVCLSATVPAVAAASDTSLTYYADLGDGTKAPEKHVVTYDPSTRRITQDVYPGTSLPPATTFSGTPAQRRQIAEHVVPEGSTPIFRYFAYDTATIPTATLALPGPVATADLGRIARVSISYVARAGSGTGSAASRAAVTYSDDVYFRAADPNDPAPYPTCA
jgi:Tfp pilus assembly protein PilW